MCKLLISSFLYFALCANLLLVYFCILHCVQYFFLSNFTTIVIISSITMPFVYKIILMVIWDERNAFKYVYHHMFRQIAYYFMLLLFCEDSWCGLFSRHNGTIL